MQLVDGIAKESNGFDGCDQPGKAHHHFCFGADALTETLHDEEQDVEMLSLLIILLKPKLGLDIWAIAID